MHLVTLANPVTNTITAIMLVLTAVGCFLVGIHLMSRGFVQASQSSTNFFTRGFNCRNRFGGFLAGFGYTAVVQSSDVTSVTLVRLTDIGFITLFQACACIIGANLGTTVTTFIVSLSSLNVTPYFAFFAFIGAIPLLSKKKGLKIFGEIVAGFGILFIGLQLLHDNTENPAFQNLVNFIFNSTSHPLLLVAIGIGLTIAFQSSTVVTSMVVFLVGSSLGISSALCLVVGANVGTCITSWIASIGASKTGRQVAMFHTFFNVVGAILFLIVLYTPLRDPFFNLVEGSSIDKEFIVAIFHFVFNLCAALVMIPLLRPSVWLCKKIVRH